MPESHPYDLPPAEYDAFERACKRHGFVPADFEITASRAADGVGGALLRITVVRVVGSDAETYRATDGVAWTVAFERDLEADVFGFPLAD